MSFNYFFLKYAYISDKKKAENRFSKLKKSLKTEGVMIGAHKRIAIPKSAISEKDLMDNLGFTKVLIAVPEQGQENFKSFRHHKNNYHLHDHESHWTMHKDDHPSATMAIKNVLSGNDNGFKSIRSNQKERNFVSSLKRKSILAGKIIKSVGQGIPHVVTEGVPGMYYYVRGRLMKSGRTLDVVLKGQNKKFTNKIKRWNRMKYSEKK